MLISAYVSSSTRSEAFAIPEKTSPEEFAAIQLRSGLRSTFVRPGERILVECYRRKLGQAIMSSPLGKRVG